MKKTVVTFGLIAGLIISVLMDGSLLVAHKIGSGHSMALGYAIMVASFLLIYFGVRSYRDNELAGQISFGRAFTCGILITLITTVIRRHVGGLYFNFIPHFMDGYFAAQIHKVQSSGLDSASIAASRSDTALPAAVPKPVRQHGYTFIEPFHWPNRYFHLCCRPPPQKPC